MQVTSPLGDTAPALQSTTMPLDQLPEKSIVNRDVCCSERDVPRLGLPHFSCAKQEDVMAVLSCYNSL